MIIFFLKRLRKLFKSIGKLEYEIIDKLKLIEKNEDNKFKKFNIDKQIFLNFLKSNQNRNCPNKLAIVICFFYNQKKIKILRKTVSNLKLLKFKKNLTILTNQLNLNQKKTLINLVKTYYGNFNLIEIKNLPDDNLLPWYSINVMKKKFKDKNNSHFLFLEDDILITQNNINYWVFFRKILNKFGLVPGFIRYENFNKKKISVDNPKKLNLNLNPVLFTLNKKNGFINSKYPYQAMYIMDRPLMGEYLKSNATKIDFSFSNNFMKNTYPIKELANISFSYLNIPKGYHNRLVVPFVKKKLPDYCLIKHNETKYVKYNKLTKKGYGTIDIDNLIV